MKLYVVTSGKYSDIRVVGVFTSKQRAEDYVKLHTDGTATVAIFEANKPEPKHLKYFYFIYTEDYKLYKCIDYEGDYYEPDIVKRIYTGEDRYAQIVFDVYADSREKAKKIAQDRIAEYKYRVEVEEIK